MPDLAPLSQGFSGTARSFWDRREGTTGKIVLAAGGVAAVGCVLFFWGLILPFLIGVMANTVQLVLLVLAVGALTSPIWSSRVRLLVGTCFKLSMRWSTQLLIETDPIGILREHVLDMKKDSAVLSGAVEKVAKATQGLQDAIDKNRSTIQDTHGKSLQTDKMLADLQRQLAATPSGSTQAFGLRTKISGLNLSKTGFEQTAGMAMQSIKQESAILTQSTTMYENLIRYQQLMDFKIQEFTQNADMLEERRKVILAGASGLGVMQKLLGGNSAQDDLISRDIDYLNDEASDVKGKLSNFNRWSDKYLTDMDIQNGAAAGAGADVFASLEQLATPLSLPDGSGSIPTIPVSTTYAPSSSNDYADLLK